MTNEPTTGEIVRELREDCNLLDDNTGKFAAAYRLESQEQKLELLNGGDFDVIDIPAALAYLESVEEILPHASALIDLIQSLKGTAIELTARAEQAERERDAFIDKIRGRCSECEYEPLTSIDEPCASCHTKNGYPNWTWRGLPQEGEGV